MKSITIGDATLYHGDSLEILPQLGECADILVCDPPYKLTTGGAAPEGSIAEWQLSEDYTNDGSLVTCNVDWVDFMPLFYKSLRGNAHAYVMCNNRHVRGMMNAAEDSKFRFHNLLVWDKGTATPNRFYMKSCEFTGFFFKGKAKYIKNMGDKTLVYVQQENFALHPTVKPVGLMQFYIENSSNVGDVVIDPFMGTCSTGLAAIRSGRKFIGIELEEKWFNASVKRIEDFYNKPQQISML